MNIMFCLGSMTKGGAERVIANLSNEFCQKDDICIVVTPPDEPMYELDKRIKFITLDRYEDKKSNILIRTTKRIIRLRKIIKDINPDIIVSLLPEPTYRVMIAKMFLNKKTIISVRNDPNIEYNTFLKRLLVKLLYTKANGFIFQTTDAQKYFSEKIQKKSIVIPNPINEGFICEPYNGVREKIIVTVGRLVEQKNHKLLIDAFYEVQKKHREYILKIYGEGPLKKDLQEQINKLNLNEKIFLMGETNNIKEEIYKAYMFVLSSDYEGMPNALMEAMALGLPCVSTDCPSGGPKYLISDKENGLLFEVGNKEELIDSINLLIENKKLVSDIGCNANKIGINLNCKKINEQWIKYIQNVRRNG